MIVSRIRISRVQHCIAAAVAQQRMGSDSIRRIEFHRGFLDRGAAAGFLLILQRNISCRSLRFANAVTIIGS
jgi:hypothetical protein